MRMTIHKIRLLVGVLLSLILISPVSAQGDQSLRGKLEQAIEVASQNQLKIVSLNQTALPNIFEVELNTGEVLYSDISGDYLFAGDMYATSPGGLTNLSASSRQQRAVLKQLADIESAHGRSGAAAQASSVVSKRWMDRLFSPGFMWIER